MSFSTKVCYAGESSAEKKITRVAVKKMYTKNCKKEGESQRGGGNYIICILMDAWQFVSLDVWNSV